MSYKIYIIEDEAIVAQDLKVNLELLGFHVLGIAHDSEKALHQIPLMKPDIVLSDIVLRDGSDGIEIIHALNKILAVPVILVSANCDKETLQRAKQINPLGYILKPVNRHELEIAIELAINEFSRQQKQLQSQRMVETALACIGDSILLTDIHGFVSDINTHACQLLGVERRQVIRQPWHTLMICPTPESKQTLASLIDQTRTNQSFNKILPIEINLGNTITLVDGLIAPITDQHQQCIGVTIMLRCLSRHEQIEQIEHKKRTSDQALATPNHACLVLINPDTFESVNQQWGTQVGDLVLGEISQLINSELRAIDLATRYGGAVFSTTLPNTRLNEGLIAIKRIHNSLTCHRYYDHKISLTFSIGFAALENVEHTGDSYLPIEMFRHATWALNAAHGCGGDCIRNWQGVSQLHSLASEQSQAVQAPENVNNDIKGLMMLLNTLVHCRDIQSLSQGIVDNLLKSMSLVAGALFLTLDEEPIELIAKNINPALTCLDPDEFDFGLGKETIELSACAAAKVFSLECDNNNLCCYGMPLNVDHRRLGLLVLYRTKEHLLQGEQISALETFSGYLGIAIDRVLLAYKEQDRIEKDLQSFEANVLESQIIFSSTIMEELIQEVRMLAPTDAPVMVTGESGTGKELLAKMIHNASLRQHKPFVVVDCAAIVPSLIASELFGHKKGAFTHASESHQGKFKQADGGTLFLDEIGELPLDLQIKLLRFAQEKSFSRVGSNQVETVDVRLIVATNRDLASEVDKGRFRKDLFYRLNVFTLHSPSLRHRSTDILPIAQHYLSQFNQHYNKTVKGFTETAEHVMRQHDWPGNVRELRNQLMRAVIICNSHYIDAKHLKVTESAHHWQSRQTRQSVLASENMPIKATNDDIAPSSQSMRSQSTRSQPIASQPVSYPFAGSTMAGVSTCREQANQTAVTSSAQRQDEIGAALTDCINILQDSNAIFECGKWLENELIRLAKIQGDGNISQSARLLGLPEATLRRRIETLNPGPLPPLLQSQQARIVSALSAWLALPSSSGVNKLQRLRLQLSRLAEQCGMNRQNIAYFVGISVPTLRKILAT